MTDVSIKERDEKPKNSGKLAKAAFMDMPYGSLPLYATNSVLEQFNSLDEPDKMGKLVNLSWHQRLKMIRFYYEFDPIISRVIEKHVDIAISPLLLDRNECTDTEYRIYQEAARVLNKALESAALEYMISGLVIPNILWDMVPAKDLDLRKRGNLEMPTNFWVQDPALVILKQDILSNAVRVFIQIPDRLRQMVKNPTGSDKVVVESLKKDYPEFYKSIKEGKPEVELEDAFLIRRKATTYNQYPTPYLLSVVESLEFKRNLKKMDYAIASRVISAIQLIRLGDADFPLTEDDEDQLTKLQTEMRWRQRTNNLERVFQLFGNHTLQIDWVYPNTEAMLNQEKYDAIDRDIFYGLAFPRILLSGETMKSATSQAEYAMFSPAESMKRMREDLLEWAEEIIRDIQKRNNLRNRVGIRFDEIRLYDLEKLSGVAAVLYEDNAISLTSLAKSAGYNFEDEVLMKKRELDLMKKYDIPEFPAKPYSPSPTNPNKGGVGDESKPDEEEVP